MAVLEAPTVASVARRGQCPATEAHRDMAQLHHDKAGNDPASLEMLERLDDLVYDAIAGQPGAFDELTRFWPEASGTIGRRSAGRIARAISALRAGPVDHQGTSGIQDPQRAMGALDVLCLLFPEGEF